MRDRHIYKSVRLIITLIVCSSLACVLTPEIVMLQRLGSERFAKGEFNEAITYYEDALKLNPKSAPIHFSIGMCYFNLKMDKKAAWHFIRAWELDDRAAQKIKYEKQMEASYRRLFMATEVLDTAEAYYDFLRGFPEMIVKYSIPGRLEDMKYFNKASKARLKELQGGKPKWLD